MLAGAAAHAARWAGDGGAARPASRLLVVVMRKSWELELVCTGWLERGRARGSTKDRAGAGQPPGRHRLDKKYTRLNIWKLPRTAHHRPTLHTPHHSHIGTLIMWDYHYYHNPKIQVLEEQERNNFVHYSFGTI